MKLCIFASINTKPQNYDSFKRICQNQTRRTGRNHCHRNALVEKSLQEKGCIAYGCFANTTDPTVFLICETWADENALAAHKQTPHYIELAGKLHRMTEMKAEKFTF